MGFINWFSGLFKSGQAIPVNGEGWADDPEFMALYTESCYRDMALWVSIDLIAKSISKCEFKCYLGGKEDKGPEWYRWNIQPNKNQNSSAFLRKLVSQLYYTTECLVVGHGDQIFVADSFNRKPYALYDDVFTGVTVGDFTFSKSFSGAEVLYWNLNSLGDNRSVRSVIEAVCSSYAKLLSYGMKAYQKSRGSKAIFKYDAFPEHVKREEQNAWLKAQLDKYSKFLSADGGVATAGKGLSLDEFGGSKTYSNESTRDIRSMIDDISDFTAKALGIPPALVRGDVEGISDALDQFLTFCIDPLADMLREEIVRKTIGPAGLMRGDDLIIDTKQIRHVDLLNSASNIDKLISSGVCCVNDILKLMGEQIINEDWAWRHFITKNYVTFDEALAGAEGGDK